MPVFDDSSYESGRDRDHQPLTYWGGHPIYAATLLVIIHVSTLLFWMLVTAMHRPRLMALLSFSSETVLRGWLWQPLTYALVHPPAPAMAVLGFAFEMYVLWIFGRELERFFGRRVFLRFYALTWLLLPTLHLGIAWLEPQQIEGSQNIHLAVFLAFATLYPSARMFFGFTARWIAIILVGAQAIAYIAENAWFYLLIFGLLVAWAYYFVRYEKGELTLPSFRFRLPRRKPKFHVVPRPAPPVQKVKLTQSAASMDDVDALLDKIARTGLSSLSPAERARLERASADLKKRPEPH